MEIPLLHDIVIIFGLAILIFFICFRLRLPAIVGLLITGILAGPHGLGLVAAVHEVEILAEIGVILLLFTIGIEFSLKSLMKIKRSVLLGGSLQVLLTIGATTLIARQLNWPTNKAIFLGFLISLSSTAIVLKLLQERGEVDSPHGRTVLAILIFQDIAVVPMLLFTPLLAGQSGNVTTALLILLLKGVGAVLFVIVATKWLVPFILLQIVRTRSRELFLLSIVAICFTVAGLTARFGLSLALGAFLAGLIISESEYSHQAFGNILPFRDIFTSFFFVSIGMLLDIRLLFAQPAVIAILVLGIIVLKALSAGGAIAFLGFPVRTMVIVGLTLAQIAEFSFILSKAGVVYGLLTNNEYQIFLAVSVLTMVVSPFVIAAAGPASELVDRLPLPQRLKTGLSSVSEQSTSAAHLELKDHLIIVGFGLNGHNVARAAKVAGIPYTIIEMNADTISRAQKRGEPIYYGDAAQETVLEHAGIRSARVMVIAISDAAATRRITSVSHALSPKLHIIARTRFILEMKPLYELGAAEVIPEEFETSVEIFTRVLAKFLIPHQEIEKFVGEVRADGYEMFRSLAPVSSGIYDLKQHLSDMEISTMKVKDNSPLCGKTLSAVKLRKIHGITVLTIRRNGDLIPNPDGDTEIHLNDTLIIMGQPEKISAFFGM